MDKIVPYLHTLNLPYTPAPLSVQINVTNRCYSKCVMCAKWRDWPKDDLLTSEKLMDIVRIFNAMGVQSAVFSGGEPFAREDLLEIVKSKGDLKVGVLTSGLWNEKLDAQEIVKNLDLIHFSLDAVDNKVYNMIRGTTGNACDKVKRNIIFTNDLIKSGVSPAQIKVNIVEQKLNINEIRSIVEFCDTYDIPYRVSPVHTFDELKANGSENLVVPQHCVVPFFHCVIDADGEVFLCCHLLNDNDYFFNRSIKLSIGNVTKENFAKIWYGRKAESLRHKLLNERLSECLRCDNRYIHINKAYEEYTHKSRETVFL